MTPPAPRLEAAPPRAALGSARDLRARLPARHDPPLAVALWAGLFAEEGLLGAAARRRALRRVLRALPAAVVLSVTAVAARWPYTIRSAGAAQVLAFLALAAALVLVTRRAGAELEGGGTLGRRTTLELGALTVLAAAVAAQLAASAGLAGEASLHPLVYLVLCAWAALSPRPVALLLAGFAVALEAACWWGRGANPGELAGASAAAGFAVAFALLQHGVLGSRVAATRRAERVAVARRRRELDRRARELRLLASASAGAAAEGGIEERAERAERLTEAAVLEAGAAARGLLEVAEVGLRAHAVAIWSLSADDAELRAVGRACPRRAALDATPGR